MKTVDIIKGLLETSTPYIWDKFESAFICRSCRSIYDKHTTDCKWVKYTEAAKEYLRLMEGSKK